MNHMTVIWPAVIKYEGDAELAFVADQATWEADFALHRHIHRDGDLLIDSEGKMFALAEQPGKISLAFKPGQVSLEDMVALLRAHAVQDGACCVSKFSADSIAEAVQLVRGMV